MAWSKEMFEELKLIAAPKKLSASQMAYLINKKFKTGLTRNAVIGMAHRKGIHLLKVKRAKARLGPKPPSGGLRVKIKPVIQHLNRRERARLDPIVVNQISARCTIFHLGTGLCHWPLFRGDEPIDMKFFCGDPTQEIYCDVHLFQSLRINSDQTADVYRSGP